jgi:uncharacterized membrane protein
VVRPQGRGVRALLRDPRVPGGPDRGRGHLDRLTKFDVYPFILLNLAFSLQAAYAAPLILLAQTRQADRDKAHAEADAQHREAIAEMNEKRQILAGEQTTQLVVLLQQNTKLTELTTQLSQRIETLTREMHDKLLTS